MEEDWLLDFQEDKSSFFHFMLVHCTLKSIINELFQYWDGILRRGGEREREDGGALVQAFRRGCDPKFTYPQIFVECITDNHSLSKTQ